MFERGIYEHVTQTLFEPVIHVPLMISRPGQEQREDVLTPTSGVDLLPTLLKVAAQQVPDWVEGRVLPGFGDADGAADRSVYSVEAKANPKRGPLTKGTVAVIRGEHKLIHYRGYDGHENEFELYDLAADPEEMVDLYASNRALAADLQGELEAKLREVNEPQWGPDSA
jgi:arylsulfatase A-like enzyme